MSRNRPKPARRAAPAVESLEGRTLLSGTGHAVQTQARPALVQRVRAAIQFDPAGYAAILNAVNGGLGSEWVKLIRSQVRNPAAVILGFVSGKYTSYSIPGLTVKTPNVQPQFAGQPYDQLLASAAGAAVFKGSVLELGAIMRGPFHDPATSHYIFALDRGAGTSLGPRFAVRPRITPDTLVTLAVGPYGTSATGTITDLRDGSSQPIDASNIKIVGPTVRVFLKTSQLPSLGFPFRRYRFTFWTQTQPGTDISTVASFAPETTMIPIGVFRRISPTR